MEYNKTYIEQERESLVDYVTSQGPNVGEHLGYVVNYLNKKIPFSELKEHLKNLPFLKTQETPNIKELVYSLNEEQLQVVKDYFTKSIDAYLKGDQNPEFIYNFLDVLIDLKLGPIPDTARIPPGSLFHKGKPGRTLADAIEEV